MVGLAISFAADIRAIQAELPRWAQDRVPSITRNALNDAADDGRAAEMAKIAGVFDRPTAFIERSPRLRKATKDDLEAQVFISDDRSGSNLSPQMPLAAEVLGGPRRAKRFEVLLRARGIMRPDEYAIPAIGQVRDAYGNLPGSLIVRMLSQLQAFGEMGFKANETAKSRKRNLKRGVARYFVPSGVRQERGISRLPRGIYERNGKSIRAVVIFVSGAPRYGRRYDFGQATIAKARRVFEPYWTRYFYAELAKRTMG